MPLMIDADYLKPLSAAVESTRAAYGAALAEPLGAGSAALRATCQGAFLDALCELAGAVAGLIEAAEPDAAPAALH